MKIIKKAELKGERGFFYFDQYDTGGKKYFDKKVFVYFLLRNHS